VQLYWNGESGRDGPCDNGYQIQCSLLWGGSADENQDQAKDADWDIELARLLIICSNSL